MSRLYRASYNGPYYDIHYDYHNEAERDAMAPFTQLPWGERVDSNVGDVLQLQAAAFMLAMAFLSALQGVMQMPGVHARFTRSLRYDVHDIFGGSLERES